MSTVRAVVLVAGLERDTSAEEERLPDDRSREPQHSECQRPRTRPTCWLLIHFFW
jgi:hypothetical protein